MRSRCAHWLWQSVPLRRASCTCKRLRRGTFCQQRQKVPKERRQNQGFEILSATEVLIVSVPSCPTNRITQISCRAFASSLRLTPRRAPRLCWPIETGSLCVCRAAGSAPHPPGRAHGPCPTNHPVGRHPCVPPSGLTPHPMQKSCHCEASAHTGCGNPPPPSFRSFPAPAT